MALLNAHNITVGFGGVPLFERIGLTVEAGERVCLVGRNGTGKSTLLNVFSGAVATDTGTVAVEKGARVSMLLQEAPADLAGTAREAAIRRAGDGPDQVLRVEQYLSRLSVDPDHTVSTMSGGERRRVLLAAALAAEWNILLLDEPTNHLDIDSIEWLERTILTETRSNERAVVFVSHDRAFSRRVASRVVALDKGRLYSFPGDYDTFVQRREEAMVVEERHEAEFDKKLAEEEAWLRRGVKARRTRDEGRVRALQDLREQYRSRRTRQGTARMGIAAAERSGDLVIETKALQFSWGAQAIVDDLETTILKGDRVGIVGPNGSGKTTLLRLLLGELTPTAGSVRHGTGLQVEYFDQLRGSLNGEATLYHAFGQGYDSVEVDGRRRHVLAYMQDFLFDPDDRNRPVNTLSGGERNRVILARLFARRPNVLVLDEPTNDLDQETLELLETLLADYPGTILLVSHDRDFLDNVVSECLVLTGDGVVEEHAGGYSDWSRRYHERREAAARQDPSPETSPETDPQDARPRLRERRLSYREQQELDALPDRIEALESEQIHVNEALSDPALYQTDDGTRTTALTARLAEIQESLAEAYDRWEELSDLA
ncbi:MAG: ATP-binding cassette domain-containing protein [Alkalispirochaeta sp.]